MPKDERGKDGGYYESATNRGQASIADGCEKVRQTGKWYRGDDDLGSDALRARRGLYISIFTMHAGVAGGRGGPGCCFFFDVTLYISEFKEACVVRARERGVLLRDIKPSVCRSFFFGVGTSRYALGQTTETNVRECVRECVVSFWYCTLYRVLQIQI
jgi:hypothetical protein